MHMFCTILRFFHFNASRWVRGCPNFLSSEVPKFLRLGVNEDYDLLSPILLQVPDDHGGEEEDEGGVQGEVEDCVEG